MSLRDRRLWAAAAALAAVALAFLLTSGGDDTPGVPVFGASLADPVPYDGRSPALPATEAERVLVELPRPALGGRPDAARMSPARRRAYVASLRDEADALIGALEARDVRLRQVVTFERAFHGFAATVDEADLPALASLGVRVRPNRRFFPAFSEPVPAEAPPAATPAPDAPEVAVLAGGVSGSRAGGYDAVDGDRDPSPEPDPRDPGREEVGGAALAAAVEGLGARARVIRISALAEGEEHARTDTLLAGLERAVDPDGDGDTSDHAAVALVGVSAPYAGFADAPEAIAVRGAERLGTLVVAPAGHEGRAAGAYGTIGSPGAAAVAAAPLSPPAAVARTTLQVGEVTVAGAVVLGGTPPDGALRTARPVAANSTEALLVANSPPLDDRLAIVEAGDNPPARVAAAAGAGAAAVLLAEPREGRPLPALPAGRVGVPVLGVTGEAAAAVLAVQDGAQAEAIGLATPRPPFTTGGASRYVSEGPAYDGAAKPDLTRPGSIVADGVLVTGAAVAAARVAVEAARLRAPDAAAAREQLVPPPDAEPPAPPPAPQVPVEGISLTTAGGVTGIQFTLGRFERGDPTAGDPGTEVVPAAELELTLVREGGKAPVERLTPPGGQPGVLPGAYAFTLPRRLVRGLERGRYAFRVWARAPRQAEPTVAVSEPFDAP